ncbi:50S ribosomal protein L9 [Croceimicrobium sp.]|uniref:50S ribosomal protein L9 n=1 Tax=Croceimicrobium sp. TaxID=2828340 RepID=UPI003BABF136
MEVILKQDVEHLGYKDDVVTVKNGYGRNYLIPQGYAELATPSAKKVLAENIKQRMHKEAKAIEDAKKTAEGLNGLEIKMIAKVGKGNKLFGSLNNADLADELAKNGHSIDRKYIQIQGGTVKATGPYVAHIRLHREVNVEFNFEVVAEQA